MKIPGRHSFKSIRVGLGSACGLTTQGDAYCWSNHIRYGNTPDRAIGSLGLSPDSTLHVNERRLGQYLRPRGIWRSVLLGLQLGGPIGHWYSRGRLHATPEQVAGNLTFSAIAAGAGATCAITPAGVAYCWGSGRLRERNTDDSYVPARVKGNLTFVWIGSGNGSACGIASGDVYCWGYNQYGELGNGTTTSSLVPEKTLLKPTP